MREAASRAAARSAKSPKAVGPEPVSRARGRTGAAKRIQGVADLGAQRAGGGLEVVGEQVRVGERRGAGAGHRAEPGGEVLQLGAVATEPEPVRLGEDVRGS